MNSKTGKLVVLRFAILIVFLNAMPALAVGKAQGPLKDLYFGEALYYAYQGEYFDAISRLDTELAQYYGLDEPNLNSLYQHIDHAEFSVGDFELFYRMHNRAGRAIKAVIEGNVEEVVRNEAIYRLAKMYFQKQQPINALHTIERIKGELPATLQYEEPFLRAQIYMVNGKFTDAIELLKNIESVPSVLGFAGYNLGVAKIQNGEEPQGLLQLDKVGKLPGGGRHLQGMRDKANLVLGYRLLEAEKPQQARQYLDRVRFKGPFSNKALLGSGWAAAAEGKFDRALVPWIALSKRNVTDASVQEVLMGVPYAYGKLELHGKAALLYGQALEAYNKEIERLDASVKSIREGSFLKAVVREELKRDKNWLVKLRDLPETPETYYLMQMMASHDFQESLKNYFDLVELKKKLDLWENYIKAFEDIIVLRSRYYEPLLPEIGKQFRLLDSKMKLRTAQRDSLDKRLKKMLVSARPDVLINVDERMVLQKLQQLTISLTKQGKLDPVAKQRIARLKGVIHWNVVTQYDDRFTKAHKHLRELDKHVEKLTTIYQSFVRTRQTATQSYKGFDKPLRRLSIKINQAQSKVKVLMARQGHMIEVMAVKELENRRKRLEEYQVKARFALAESYDRATKKQVQHQLEEQDKLDAQERARQTPKESEAEPKLDKNTEIQVEKNSDSNNNTASKDAPTPSPQVQDEKQKQGGQ